MKKKNILFFLLCFLLTSLSAQTLEQARGMYGRGQYAEAKPVFQKYVKSQPANGNYNLWYGVCCLKTGNAAEALKYLETAVRNAFRADSYIWLRLIMIYTAFKMQ